MTAFEISDIKYFMGRLLGSTMFDHFLLTEGVIRAGITYTLDGHINASFYSEEDLEQLHLKGLSYLPFSYLRGTCFQMIKGKNTPLSFRFVFMLSPENMAQTLARSQSRFGPDDISGMFLNITYQNGRLLCTTGISYRLFSPDKTLEYEWADLAERFFHKNQIAVERSGSGI